MHRMVSGRESGMVLSLCWSGEYHERRPTRAPRSRTRFGKLASMAEAIKRWNSAVLWALLLAVGALSVNFVFFVNPPLRAALPWVSLALTIAALVVLAMSVRFALVYSHIYRGKLLSMVLRVVTLILSAANIFLFFHARALPSSSAAPQIGQQLPDFTLSDTNGQSVSLDSLFSPSSEDVSSTAPKAVLLIFYRGYW
jgi:hypothetical protein